ncbi:hypothetical protein V2A60_001089 [Cordyceps javanica]
MASTTVDDPDADLEQADDPSVTSGNTSGDPDNAGYFGYTVLEVHDEVLSQQIVSKFQPHYIFLLVGANNMGNDELAGQAPADLRKLLAELFHQGPRTSVLVGTLIQTALAEINTRVGAFNPELEGIVSELSVAGYPISSLDLSTSIDPASDLKDIVHPNDKGYENMAAIWFKNLKHRLPGSGVRLVQDNPHFQTTSVVPARSFDVNYIAMWRNHGMVIDLADSGSDLYAVSPLSMHDGISTTFGIQQNIPVSVTFRVRDCPVTQLCPKTGQQLHVRSNVDNTGLYINTTVGDSTWRAYQYLFTPRTNMATLTFQALGEVEVCGPSIADVIVQQDSSIEGFDRTISIG